MAVFDAFARLPLTSLAAWYYSLRDRLGA